MSVPLTGDVTSRQIAGCLEGNPNSSFSLKSGNSRFVTGKGSGDIAFSDWRGKAWRQGAGSPLPVGCDKRLEGFYSEGSRVDASTDYWRCNQEMSDFYNGEYKGTIQANSYFYSEPRDLYLSGTFSAQYSDKFSGRVKYGFLYIWAYTSGYLSGNRVQLFSQQREWGARTYDREKITVPAGYPYVALNFGTWCDGKNTVTPGQEISVWATFENMKIET